MPLACQPLFVALLWCCQFYALAKGEGLFQHSMEDQFLFCCGLVGDGGYKSYEHPTSIVFNFLPNLQVSNPSLQYNFDV
jgi:hypothetical protein